MSARLERLIELGLNVVITEDPSIFSEEARKAGDELLRLAGEMWDECAANGDGSSLDSSLDSSLAASRR